MVKRCLQVLVFSIMVCCLTVVLMQTTMAADMRVTRSGVNFRTEASLESSVIRSLDAGTSVELIEHDPAGWSKVRVNGTVGYIRSDFLTVPEGAEAVTFTTTDGVNFRTGASLDASVITTLQTGTNVEMLEHDPTGWSKVRVNDTVGFVRSDFLTLPIQNSQQNTDSQQNANSQQSTNASSQSPSTLRTIDGVNFRTGPSTDASIIRTLNANTEVEVIEYDATGWSRVRVDGDVGFIRSDLLSVSGRNVELLHWSEVKNILPTGVPLRVYDVRTGISYNIQVFSKGDHADVEPVTRADTDAKLQSRNGVWSWAARPVWVTIGDRMIAASLIGMPHDVSTISDNGMNGHLCLHFYGSTTSSTSATYKADLQNAVQEAWNAR